MELPPNSWLDFLLHALATYRLSLMVAKESGPGWIFKIFRRTVKRKAPKATHLDEGIECLFCVSAQLGILVACLRSALAPYAIYQLALFALAISAVAVVLNQTFTQGKL